ncbi:MAG: protein translocase subunit SecD [Bacteriovoracales bacterium]|nr:protein translocase subunit SecD [Bacteriovoracales bacterium]
MKKSWWFKLSFLSLLALWALASLAPSFMDMDEEGPYPLKSKLNLGLDLQGGLYMVLGIDFNKVYRDEIKTMARNLMDVLEDKGMTVTRGTLDRSDPQDPKQSLLLGEGVQMEKAKEAIKSYGANAIRLTKEEGNEIQYGLIATFKRTATERAVGKSIEVIRNRIDEFGVTEPEIIALGEDRIVVQLPGVKDIERAKSLIGTTAKLEFKMVNDEVSPTTLQTWLAKAREGGIEFKKGERFSAYLEKLNHFLQKDLPKGWAIAFQKKNNNKGEVIEQTPFLVEESSRLTGDELQDASTQIDPQQNQPYVSMNFKVQGAKIFEEITGANVGKRLAVILDGNVYTAPNIQSRIAGGRAQITLGQGSFSQLLEEAQDISLVLRAGALPVELEFQEQRVVGAGLGNDAIEKARLASLIGVALVFCFILIYYKLSGFLALMTLGLNLLFILAALVAFEATLTLPGVAGIALTVGMAVDANIIIYERIREEWHQRKDSFKAVENGFQSAFWTILDANITTALAGTMLLNFGTGPIRGFAVTLLIGIAATVYTSYFCSRMFFEFYMNRVQGTKLSI